MSATVVYADAYMIGYIEDGTVHFRPKREVPEIARAIPYGLSVEESAKPIISMAIDMGFASYFASHVAGLLHKCDGMSVSELRQELARRSANAEAKRDQYAEDARLWAELNARFGDMVMGVDDVDLYQEGMTIEILLNSSKGFERQRAWAKDNRTALIQYVRQAMPRTKRVSKKRRQMALDLLPCCALSEIVLTRRNTIQLKYDVRKELREALAEQEE